jgi:hypothetical protein
MSRTRRFISKISKTNLRSHAKKVQDKADAAIEIAETLAQSTENLAKQKLQLVVAQSRRLPLRRPSPRKSAPPENQFCKGWTPLQKCLMLQNQCWSFTTSPRRTSKWQERRRGFAKLVNSKVAELVDPKIAEYDERSRIRQAHL